MTVGKLPRMVIGLDFGTTFSGVAWALDDGCPTSQKVPSVFYYDGWKMRWGYQVNDCQAAIHGVKLLLDDNLKYSYGPSCRSKKLLQSIGKDVTEAAGDYVREIVSHAKNVLHHRFGKALESMDLQFFMTVPAIWSDKAKDATMQIACQAGIAQKNLYMISEPEAAAEGDWVIDLITYCITQAEPLRLAEVTEGSGDVCGSVILDDNFEGFLKQKIGNKTYARLSDDAKWAALSRWRDYIKPHYQGPNAPEDDFVDVGYYTVPVPGAPDNRSIGLQREMLSLESKEIEGIFEPVVMRVEELLTQQQLKAVILVGGLGASDHLRERLKRAFTGVQILQPHNAWSAVVRLTMSISGAVLRGVEGCQIDTRKARCHYGIRVSHLYDTGSHEEKHRYWCPLEEKWKVDNCMSWFIRKGESIAESTSIRLDFYRNIRAKPKFQSFVFEEELQFCVADLAPDAYDSSQFVFSAVMTSHYIETLTCMFAAVSKLCCFEADLSKIPKELFEKH
ncbi:hypothetical protein PDE_06060 [Penicillium oxalicum 114-2]|uniref:Actin-like ATPase domain-containing protein n=1 Tax=Penicillium oxalicum (strain 114-2 / CGMCC 5302) TaxID=933388 RepID=S7ZKD9_PENO1|nr:hypothetical protein PDE_06060 [Penicillium oxalicum 114-2]